VKRVINYVRSKTWLCPPWGPPRLNELIGKEAMDTECKTLIREFCPFSSLLYLTDVFSDADRERFKDPVVYKQFRHELEMEMTVRSQSLTITKA
jgi:hypothetical protein